MFTGLIKYTGTLAARDGSRLRIDIPAQLAGALQAGDSIAVNGVCLTAIKNNSWSSFEADLLPATLADTTLGSLAVGSVVNVELPLAAQDLLGGHFVQGHVDGLTNLIGVEESRYAFELPGWLTNWIVPKGSICIDGVSLTVQSLTKSAFTVELIPETLSRTNLGKLQPGQRVNLEADLIVKTISELMKKQR